MKKKVIVIATISTVALILIGGIFVKQLIENPSIKISNEAIFSQNIVDPDRIVYRNKEGLYFEFLKDTSEYNEIKNLIAKSTKSYTNNGAIIKEEKIEDIHSKTFIEFDYKTASKNFIIQLEDNKNEAIIKLAQTGGRVCTEKIDNFNKIKRTVEKFSENINKKAFTLEYKQMLSRNVLNTIDYKYLQEFKEISYKIHQVKIEDMNTYNLYKKMCSLAFDELITETVFENNILILTLSLEPKIDVKVNLGNIKYTYDKLEGFNYGYTAHLLIVSKIVNTDCIYNTDLLDIQSKVDYDNMATNYDKQVEQIDRNIFVTDFDKFFEEYEKATTTVSEDTAKQIAQKGFEEAKRIAGSYDESTQEITSKNTNLNNFFTRKINQGDWTSDKTVEVYCFTRTDDMLNGVNIYVDKKLGKIIGGAAFGD